MIKNQELKDQMVQINNDKERIMDEHRAKEEQLRAEKVSSIPCVVILVQLEQAGDVYATTWFTLTGSTGATPGPTYKQSESSCGGD